MPKGSLPVPPCTYAQVETQVATVGPCLEAKLSLDAAKPRLTVQPGATVYSSSCPIRTGMTAPSMYVPHWILYLPGDTYYKTLHVAEAVPLGTACAHLFLHTLSHYAKG